MAKETPQMRAPLCGDDEEGLVAVWDEMMEITNVMEVKARHGFYRVPELYGTSGEKKE